MKKLLFVTTRLFWPTDSGRKVSLYYYCKGLHEQYGYEIYIYSFLEPGQSEKDISSKPDFIKHVQLAKPIGKFTKLKNLASKSLFAGWPFQNSIYYSKGNAKAIKKLCEQVKPDVVFVDMIRLAPYYKAIKKFDCKKILDLDDMLSKRYVRQASSANSNATVFGAFAGDVGSGSKNMLQKKGIKKLVLKSESKRTKRAEIKYGKLYDNVVFVSQKETDEYNMRLPGKAVTVRLGVDYEFYSQGGEVEKEQNSLAFLGNLKVAANSDSLSIIANHVMPKLDKDCNLYVIGAAPEEVVAQFTDGRIKFLGRVDDLRFAVKKCKIFLAPIAYGTGIKTKILEAMAMGMPIITNDVGAEGIDVENGKEIIIENNVDEMVDKIKSLLGDEETCKKLGENAGECAKKYYDWNEVYKSFELLGI